MVPSQEEPTPEHEEQMSCPQLSGTSLELCPVAQVLKAMELVGQEPEAVLGVDLMFDHRLYYLS